jgi:hypothetical protein
LKESFLNALVIFASDLSFVDENENVSEVRNGINKVIKFVAVENVGVKRKGESVFSLLNPVDGGVSSDDENMLNRYGNGMNSKEVMNGGQDSASFARLGECDGENGVNGPVNKFFSNTRATRNLVVKESRVVSKKFIRNGASKLGANFGANDSIRES